MQTYTSIFGPPGTGKTTEMLRLVEDARDRGYSPDEIGFFSFTRNAANEATKRLNLQRSGNICTLHSLAFRRTGANPMSMVDAPKLRRFGKLIGVPISASKNEEYGDNMEVGDQMIAVYDLARARIQSIDTAYYDSDDRPGSFEQFKHFVASYEDWKKAYGFTDFTDLITRYNAHPEWHIHGAKVLFIDEAQDLSPLQWEMVRHMTSVYGVAEVYIAGDDDQAIFEWSGADAHGMHKWSEIHGAEQRTLKQSFRVPVAVHDLAREIVVRIKNRVKKIYRPDERPGLVQHHGTGFDPSIVSHGDDVLILVRSHAQRKEIEEALIAQRVPYKVDGGKPGLYDSKWAIATRALIALKLGESIGLEESNAIAAAGTLRAKQYTNERNFRLLATLDMEEAIAYPPNMIEFFRNADLSQKPTIRLSTIHAAKGGEARKIVLHTGITQRTELGMLKNPDAEHRVWYTGVTRAKEELHIVSGADTGYEL